MTYIYIVYIIVTILSFASAFFLYNKISTDHWYKLAIKNLLNKQHKISNDRFFSSFAILKTVKILRRKKKNNALLNLYVAKIEKAQGELKKAGREDLAISLSAHIDHNQAIESLEALIKKQPKNMFVLGEMAEIYYIKNDFKKLEMVLDRIDDKISNNYTKAKKIYFQTFINMRDGDLMPASIDANKAAKMFNRSKAYLEESRTYSLLGLIYKSCAIYDTAQFMFETSLDIYSKLDDKIGRTESYINLAMLMSSQERFEEANVYFDKALEISKNSLYEAYILNQKGLTLLLSNKPKEAVNILQQALDMGSKTKNLKATSFSNEIMSYVKYEMKDWEETINYAKKAEDIYREISNHSAMLEAMHLQALSFFELEKFDDVEKVSREIINFSNKNQTSFHTANSYSLLGMVFIKKGDAERAKVLFKESLKLEQKNDRKAGIATDYFNIGVLEEKLGDKSQALTSLENALEFASIYGETKLSEAIKNKIKSLSQIKLDNLFSFD